MSEYINGFNINGDCKTLNLTQIGAVIEDGGQKKEIKQFIESKAGGVQIDDTTTSNNKTWSSTKIQSAINAGGGGGGTGERSKYVPTASLSDITSPIEGMIANVIDRFETLTTDAEGYKMTFSYYQWYSWQLYVRNDNGGVSGEIGGKEAGIVVQLRNTSEGDYSKEYQSVCGWKEMIDGVFVKIEEINNGSEGSHTVYYIASNNDDVYFEVSGENYDYAEPFSGNITYTDVSKGNGEWIYLNGEWRPKCINIFNMSVDERVALFNSYANADVDYICSIEWLTEQDSNRKVILTAVKNDSAFIVWSGISNQSAGVSGMIVWSVNLSSDGEITTDRTDLSIPAAQKEATLLIDESGAVVESSDDGAFANLVENRIEDYWSVENNSCELNIKMKVKSGWRSLSNNYSRVYAVNGGKKPRWDEESSSIVYDDLSRGCSQSGFDEAFVRVVHPTTRTEYKGVYLVGDATALNHYTEGASGTKRVYCASFTELS